MDHVPINTSLNRSLSLDAVRAFAIALVMGRHIVAAPADGHFVTWAAVGVWRRGGWVGVDLFFVLSGFLVSGLLVREQLSTGDISYRRFLLRRALRIYPAFWTMLAVTLVMFTMQQPFPQMRALIGELTFTQNYVGSIWQHTWSLAVEEHFYLLLCVFVWMLVRTGPRSRPFARMPALFSIVAIACLGLRIITCATHSQFAETVHVFPTHLRIDSLLFGVLIAYFWHVGDLRKRIAGRAVPLTLAGMGLLIPSFVFPIDRTPWISTVGFTMFYLGSGCLICAALSAPTRPGKLISRLAFVGKHSYSVYLWHIPVGLWCGWYVRPLVDDPMIAWYVIAACYLVGSLLLGVAMSYAIEIPMLRARDRWLPTPNSRP